MILKTYRRSETSVFLYFLFFYCSKPGMPIGKAGLAVLFDVFGQLSQTGRIELDVTLVIKEWQPRKLGQ